MPRRQFIALGSAAVVGFAVCDVTTAVAATDQGSESLAVGYVQDDLASRDMQKLISGESMSTGDPRFLSRMARVNVEGFWRRDPRLPVSITLKPYYPTTPAVGGNLPVYAWSYTSGRAVPGRFSVPVGDEGLHLEVERTAQAALSPAGSGGRRRSAGAAFQIAPRTAQEIAALPNIASLMLGHDRSALKLQTGRYVLALLPPNAPNPDWSSLRFDPAAVAGGGAGPLRARTLFGDADVPFDYLVINVAFVV